MKDRIKGVAVCSPCDVSTLSVRHVSHRPVYPSELKSVLPTAPCSLSALPKTENPVK